ncbi:MAG: hypothetical protein L0241_12575 [Planctomycetia bacterium]|nr:hypothetical protein [Planctomycetia bacterium]
MPDPTLQGTALRYAAGDLPPPEATHFEARLATDQEARDALAEAVRLSAAAIGQQPPAPHPSFRERIRARLRGSRGHPLVWVGLGAVAVAACTLVGLSLADRPPPAVSPPQLSAPVQTSPETIFTPQPAEPSALAIAPTPRESETNALAESPALALSPCGGGDPPRSVAEIWADLSTHDNLEKARDDEVRWRQKIRDLMNPPSSAIPIRPPE